MMRMLIRELRLLLVAVQFLTRLPVPTFVGHGSGELGKATAYIPAVGLLVGVLAALVFVAAHVTLSPMIAALLAITTAVLVTGGLHEDGLADTCDGVFGGFAREDVLRIMKDSHIGTFGVLGLILTVALKASALAELNLTLAASALVAGHAISRLLVVLVMALLPYARTEETSRVVAATAGVGRREAVIAAFFGLLPLLAMGIAGMIATLAAAAVVVGFARYLVRRLGGYTGDCLGAVQQIGETVFYLALLLASA